MSVASMSGNCLAGKLHFQAYKCRINNDFSQCLVRFRQLPTFCQEIIVERLSLIQARARSIDPRMYANKIRGAINLVHGLGLAGKNVQDADRQPLLAVHRKMLKASGAAPRLRTAILKVESRNPPSMESPLLQLISLRRFLAENKTLKVDPFRDDEISDLVQQGEFLDQYSGSNVIKFISDMLTNLVDASFLDSIDNSPALSSHELLLDFILKKLEADEFVSTERGPAREFLLAWIRSVEAKMLNCTYDIRRQLRDMTPRADEFEERVLEDVRQYAAIADQRFAASVIDQLKGQLSDGKQRTWSLDGVPTDMPALLLWLEHHADEVAEDMQAGTESISDRVNLNAFRRWCETSSRLHALAAQPSHSVRFAIKALLHEVLAPESLEEDIAAAAQDQPPQSLETPDSDDYDDLNRGDNSSEPMAFFLESPESRVEADGDLVHEPSARNTPAAPQDQPPLSLETADNGEYDDLYRGRNPFELDWWDNPSEPMEVFLKGAEPNVDGPGSSAFHDPPMPSTPAAPQDHSPQSSDNADGGDYDPRLGGNPHEGMDAFVKSLFPSTGHLGGSVVSAASMSALHQHALEGDEALRLIATAVVDALERGSLQPAASSSGLQLHFGSRATLLDGRVGVIGVVAQAQPDGSMLVSTAVFRDVVTGNQEMLPLVVQHGQAPTAKPASLASRY
jgi:hypothetical protein